MTTGPEVCGAPVRADGGLTVWRSAFPTHYDDYSLFKSPLADFKREADRVGLPLAIRYLGRGETYRLGLGVPPRQP